MKLTLNYGKISSPSLNKSSHVFVVKGCKRLRHTFSSFNVCNGSAKGSMKGCKCVTKVSTMKG